MDHDSCCSFIFITEIPSPSAKPCDVLVPSGYPITYTQSARGRREEREGKTEEKKEITEVLSATRPTLALKPFFAGGLEGRLPSPLVFSKKSNTAPVSLLPPGRSLTGVLLGPASLLLCFAPPNLPPSRSPLAISPSSPPSPPLFPYPSPPPPILSPRLPWLPPIGERCSLLYPTLDPQPAPPTPARIRPGDSGEGVGVWVMKLGFTSKPGRA